MEKKVMNKKFVATLALVLLVVVSLSAAPTFSGRFRQGYTFKFDANGNTTTEWKSEESKLVMKFADDNGLWTVNLKGVGALDSNDKWAANASINFGKALAGAGVDMGDFTVVGSIGNNGSITMISAYNDVTGNEDHKFKNNGTASVSLTLGYGKLVKVMAAVDPTNSTGGSAPVAKSRSVAVAATTEPVDGVVAGIAYAHNATTDEKWADKNAINGSVNVNVAKLAGLDFNLGVSAFDTYLLDAKKNYLGANVYGGYADVDAYVEFVMYDQLMGLNTQVAYSGVENLGLDVYFNIGNFDTVADTITVGGDVEYTFGGVTYAMNMEYTTSNKTFALTPKAIINF